MVLFQHKVRRFTTLFLGQVVSTIGTRMVEFSLGIWVWQETNSVMPLAITLFITFIPQILFGSFAGVLVDRLPRKVSLAVTDVMGGLSSIVALYLLSTGQLELVHVYAITAWDSLWRVFTSNAFDVTIPEIVPEETLGKVNGINSGVFNASGIVSPTLSGLLYGVIGLQGILVIDVVTFMIAVATILAVPLKRVVPLRERETKTSFVEDYIFSFKYLWMRRPLLNLMLLSVFIQVIGSVGQTLVTPLVLATHDSTAVLGYTVTAFGVGALVGGLLMGSWGGFNNKVFGILLANALICGLGYLLLGFGVSLVFLLCGAFFVTFFLPLLFSSLMTIWQTKVERGILGRVLGFSSTLSTAGAAGAVLVTGYLADNLAEPFMGSHSILANFATAILGSSAGSGIRLILVVTGLFGVVASGLLYLLPNVRNLTASLDTPEPVEVD